MVPGKWSTGDGDLAVDHPDAQCTEGRQVGTVGVAGQDRGLSSVFEADQQVGSGGRDVGEQARRGEVAIQPDDHPGA